ncbi:MAG TPA: hypothetical protein VEA16_18460, partial [Vicinamibacterales bacterium]|nr:hypothetical protein [Vicinamibacterales bacterium]
MVLFSGHACNSLRAGVLAIAVLLVGALAALSPPPALAQSSINFSGGGSIDATQVWAGVAWQSPDIGGRFRLRPGIDGGFGDDLRLGTINIDLIVHIPLGTSAWSL